MALALALRAGLPRKMAPFKRKHLKTREKVYREVRRKTMVR